MPPVSYLHNTSAYLHISHLEYFYTLTAGIIYIKINLVTITNIDNLQYFVERAT